MLYPQATSHGNILTFTPPGFNQQLNVKFPDSRLAVCAKCKKNFKTRDMCRVRNTHTTAPWTTAYICITVDESCLDENGRFVDKPMTVRMVQWQPYCVVKPFDPKTPVCAACKRTNRTRSFCRDRHKHRQLPWCSVYVLLSTLDAADPSTVVAGASKKVGDEDDKTNGQPVKEQSPASEPKGKAEEASAPGSDTIASDGGDTGDDINDISESRTFLAKVSCRSTSIHWLEMAEYDSSEAAPFPGTIPVDAQQYHAAMAQHAPPHPMDPSLPAPGQYYQQQPNMNYAAQQHQNALKSRQQYFFQMQQQHQHQYPPPPGPPQGQQGHWQQAPYHMGPPGQGEPSPAGAGATAGEAAAAQQRRGHPGSPDDGQQQLQHPGQQQHWAAMYYQGPPGGHYVPPPHDGNGQASTQGELDPSGPEEEQHEHFHTPPESANGDAEDNHDEKRQRVV